jgi:hypothetical protein
MSDHALRALVAANPHTPTISLRDDERMLRAILATPTSTPKRRPKTAITIACCLLALGATAAYAALNNMDAAKVDATLKQSAKDARPLSASELAAIRRSNAADGTLYQCLKSNGPQTDRSGGLSPSPVTKSACAALSAAADTLHRDPLVRAAFAAEARLFNAAWYCVQQQGYEINGNRITTPPTKPQLTAIWRAFASCEAKVGVPTVDRVTNP